MGNSRRRAGGAGIGVRIGAGVGMALALLLASGCVTLAEHRKLEREVLRMQRATGGGERVADLGAQLDSIDRRLAALEGSLEEVRHRSEQAWEEARRARAEAAGGPGVAPLPGPEPVPAPEPGASGPIGPAPEVAMAPTPPAPPAADPDEPPAEPGASAQEVAEYREAHAAWRAGDLDACIDRFRRFLQTHPTSPYADDAAYWMAECHFKQGDYKSAILRFDDVVARYPEGDRSADALYRQGEALLKLGPAYSKAASKAFERVVEEYPGSPRASEARRQLDLLGAG